MWAPIGCLELGTSVRDEQCRANPGVQHGFDEQLTWQASQLAFMFGGQQGIGGVDYHSLVVIMAGFVAFGTGVGAHLHHHAPEPSSSTCKCPGAFSKRTDSQFDRHTINHFLPDAKNYRLGRRVFA
jgi:hypothetical protein